MIMILLRALFMICVCLTLQLPLCAMNWEGHDDWLKSEEHAMSLRSLLPPPTKTEIPDCLSRTVSGHDNPYEQRPVPGLNCRDNGKPADLPVE